MSVSQVVKQQESHTLYNGTVRLDFDPVKHRYRINGDYAYGVTTALGIIAKPQLIYWSANMAADFVQANIEPGVALDEIEIQVLVDAARKAHLNRKNSAASQGTYIHQWIEDYVTGKESKRPINESLATVTDDFVKFWNKLDVTDIRAEQMLCSPTLSLAGTPDMICRVDGKLTIMDWKTGSGIYPEMFLQMAAYALMYEEEFNEPVEQLWVVNASIKNMFQDEMRTEVETFKEAYLCALRLYRSSKEIEKLFKG